MLGPVIFQKCLRVIDFSYNHNLNGDLADIRPIEVPLTDAIELDFCATIIQDNSWRLHVTFAKPPNATVHLRGGPAELTRLSYRDGPPRQVQRLVRRDPLRSAFPGFLLDATAESQ
jgi:hypothetical protein